MSETETPLATYTERLFQVRRRFALYADRVEIDAHWRFGRDRHMTVRLSELTPRTKELMVRNRWMSHFVLLGSLAVAIAVVLGQPGYTPAVQWASRLAWPLAGVFFALAALTFRKIRFVRLLRPDGKPGLDLAQAGPEAARFEEFLQAVRKRI